MKAIHVMMIAGAFVAPIATAQAQNSTVVEAVEAEGTEQELKITGMK